MIAFATLFLGLILGVQEIQVVVGSEVASVDILLNGRLAGTMTEKPWKLGCDFGPELLPQELVAIARDAGGEEIGRVRQWINLPQPPARVTVAFDGGEEGAPHVARLSWESRAGRKPQKVDVSFDGQKLEVKDPRTIVLPPHDERQLHFLRVELEFSDHVTSVAEIVFGGTHQSRTSIELTALAIQAKKSRMKNTDSLAGLFLKRGEPLRVVAVEQNTAQIVVVPTRSVVMALQGFHRDTRRSLSPLTAPSPDLRFVASFGRKQFLTFMMPSVERRLGERQHYDLFPTTIEFSSADGGLYHLLLQELRQEDEGEERLADAVAVAGLHVAEQRQRRAVVLMLGEAPRRDQGQLTPGQARRYLEKLRVPFEVWSLAGTKALGTPPNAGRARAAPGADPETPRREGWGEIRDVSSIDKLQAAAHELSKALNRQWLVWLDGAHLPQEIVLAPEADGLELAH